ncbi:unnamed protein product [Alopecurus aequalis]
MPMANVSARRQHTTDHPPYAWMIGEAIDALRGSATEEVISAFIIGRHQGVPWAHDRLLSHYLDKHVAEGLFICTEQGRYSRSGSHAAQVTVAEVSPDHRRHTPELALVVANHEYGPATAMNDDDQAGTRAADGTNNMMSRGRPCDAAPVHSPTTASSSANTKMKKKPRQRKVQDLYDHNVVLPPKRVPPPCSNVPADNEMWCVLALPAQVRL